MEDDPFVDGPEPLWRSHVEFGCVLAVIVSYLAGFQSLEEVMIRCLKGMGFLEARNPKAFLAAHQYFEGYIDGFEIGDVVSTYKTGGYIARYFYVNS